MYKGNNTISSVIKGSSNIAKILFNGVEVWKKGLLPDGYVLCDYLESTGTQYIDIGLKVSNKTKVDLVGKQYTSTSSLFGVNPLFVITSSQSTDRTKQLCRFRYNNTIQDTNVNILKLSKIVFDKNKGYINDVLLATFTEETFSSTYTAILFGRRINSSGALEELARQRIDCFKMWENDVLVRDMIPCLDKNGKPCMYDILNNKCYYNEGTGEFKYSINATYLQLKDFVEGFVNSSTGVVAPNSTYPRAISSPLVLFEKGKTYKVTSNLSATKTDDGVRFGIYGTDDTYKQSIAASQITTNAYATFEALDDSGKANFYVAKDILITPKQDFKTRIMYIDSNYISEFKIEEI